MTVNTVIFDWKRTLYDPDNKTLIPGAVELMELIKNKNIPMILIGKGGGDMDNEVDRLGVRKYFTKIIFAKGDKDPQIFAKFIPRDNPKSVLVIGDRVRSELEIGNKLGATTVWIKQGKFAVELPENSLQNPTVTVLSLQECIQFFDG